jgi:hypothetical protein
VGTWTSGIINILKLKLLERYLGEKTLFRDGNDSTPKG